MWTDEHRMGRIRHCCGFTLLELLVALAIFALLAAAVHSTLRAVLDVREQTQRTIKELLALKTCFNVLGRDIEQTVPRSVRNASGEQVPVLQGRDGSYDAFLELTHAGWANPMGFQRSDLQRVAYGLHDGVLERNVWLVLDRAADSKPQTAELLEKVDTIQMRFLDQDLNWHAEWPPPQGVRGNREVPRAVEIQVVFGGWGAIRRLFKLPSGLQTRDSAP